MDPFFFREALFQLDIDRHGEAEKWFSLEHDREHWMKVDVPGSWDLYNRSLWSYEGTGWFCLELPAQNVDICLLQRLMFERVSGHAKVWINGQLVGEHVGGYLPFEFAASHYLRAGMTNYIVMSVDNEPKGNRLPGNAVVEWMQYGGILRDVSFISTPHCYIDRVSVRTHGFVADHVLTFDVHLVNHSQDPVEGNLILNIPLLDFSCDKENYIVVEPGFKKIERSYSVPQAQYWSPETPNLYEVEAVFTETKGLFSDRKASRFGVRTVEVDNQHILLNGRPLTIKGINRYDEILDYGPSAPASVIRADLIKAKESGVNLIRTHYPMDSIHLNLMDELGLLVMEEIPLNWWMNNWHPSAPANEEHNEEIAKDAELALRDMIKQHCNHPSILIWSMCNESETNTPFGIEVMRRLMRLAREEDQSRLVSFVAEGNKPGHLAFEEADIVCFNVYYGAMYGDPALKLSEIHQKAMLPTMEHLQRFVREFPGKPLVITEFGTLGLQGLKGDQRHSETFQAQYLRVVWEAIMGVNGVQGGILWCWADYYHRRKYWDVPLGRYGVLTVERQEKESFKMLQELFLTADSI
ncbi:glycoside hydrolase family 2 protein [Paenibacillus sp. PAMC21692]|uniref:glycoside hydrolase family 2 protein n=1 Tax=Paenibacillus sp. PAMC21692 TaxID=2762320 RepID=UPI00164E2819|nr:glycoside hydrolase family 2 TIM barrel-domain containing protein [Paenibacillus sp. PAMC21692]QNK59520.1 hypothetical protein H7F31_12040 [Paenibacillus sp. PAMC21692]